MIQIVKYPETNRYVLDGNNTKVSVISTNGIGYYFRAKIYINDVLFDEQSWSREDNYTATKDLIYLYNAYFETIFPETFTTGLVEQTHLTKKVSITITEHLIADDSLIETLELPDFFIQFNIKSATFDDSDKLTILGLDAEVMRVPTTGNIVIPFFVNAEAEALNISATLNDETVLDTQSVSAFTDKRVYLYTLNLSEETITYYHLFLTVTLTVGSTTETRTYKLIRNPHFPVKEIVFQNNFGFFIPAYFDGELETQTGYKVETYKQLNETEVVYAIDTTLKYSINTNNLLLNENALVNQVAQALVCKLNTQNGYLKINTKTSSSKDYTDKEHLYPTKLNFEFSGTTLKENTGFVEAPICDNIVINGEENQTTIIEKSVFNTAFDPNTINDIIFTQLPTTGALFATISSVTTLIVLNTVYDYSLISNFKFYALADGVGSPYTTFKFQVREDLLFSNQATATINILEASGEVPPTISTNPSEVIYLVSSNGSVTINANITDTNGNLDTILWEFEGAAYPNTTITNQTTSSPTITVTGGEDGLFLLKCTATDTLANSSTFIVDVVVTSYIVETTAVLLPESGSETDMIYQINLTGGIEGETVEIEFDYDVYESNRFVLVNYGEETEFSISLFNRRQTFSYEFDSSGEIMFYILMDDALHNDHATLVLKTLKPKGNMVISESTEIIEI